MQVSDNPACAPISVGYVAVNAIVAIALHQVTDILPTLSFGAIEVPVASAIPSRLQLKQQVADLSQALAIVQIQVDFDSFPHEDRYRYRVFQMLETLGSVIRELIQSDLGRQALTEQVETISLGYGEAYRVQLSNRELLLTFDTVPSDQEVNELIMAAL